MTSTFNLQLSSKTGWLKKQGGLVKSWTSRWFALKGDQLYYFRKDDEVSLLGVIPLAGNKVVENPHNLDEPQNGKFFFEIIASNDPYLLLASSEDERKKWVKSLISVMFSRLGGAVFGQSLDTTMKYQKKSSSSKVPVIVEKCVNHLMKHGLDHEGIFRLTGSVKSIRTTKFAFDTCEDIDFERDDIDNNTIASLLKLYFKELPEPIIPFNLYEHFMTIGLKIQHGDPEQGMDLLRKLLDKIDPNKYNLLMYICDFLSKVAKRSSVNKMTPNNLALVFGPNILRGDDDHPLLLMSTADLTIQTVLILIERAADAFPNGFKSTSEAKSMKNVMNFDTVYDTPPGSSAPNSPILLDDGRSSNDQLKPPMNPTSPGRVDIANNNYVEFHKREESEEETIPVARPRTKYKSTCCDPGVELRRTSTRRPRVFKSVDDEAEKATKNSSILFSEVLVNCEDDGSKLTDGLDFSDLDKFEDVEKLKAQIKLERRAHADAVARMKTIADDRVKKVEETYKRKLHAMGVKLEEERGATAQSVHRLVALQAELLAYRMKFGNLEDHED
ncbi:rho GTPase-activating protein 24-like [Tubulanus polymorphus]|uniref:rho GTPase-activating protein 24-like n=1 Tax=Tubulanus polymorphus TaxID=672921 RepID=UPI003DA4DFE7